MENIFEQIAEITKPDLLSHLRQKAISAHNWTSFSPEKRGEQMIKDYSEQLQGDIEELKKAMIDDEAILSYKTRFINLFSSWINAKSSCASSMITGPANFNVRRAEKANRSEERHYEIFQEWRNKAKKAIVRKSQPEKTFISEIDRYKNELIKLKEAQELTKKGNKIIAKAKKDGSNIDEYLTTTFNIAPHMLDWTKKFGFNTVNNNANMRRIEQRIKELEQKETMRTEATEQGFDFEGGKVVVNYEADRIQVFFDTRPTKAELENWKSKGLNSFNWSPSNNAWQRKITSNAIWVTKKMFNYNHS